MNYKGFELTIFQMENGRPLRFLTNHDCGSVGRAVASYTRGPQFESSHRQKKLLNIYSQLYRKDKIKKKRPGIVHLKNNVNVFGGNLAFSLSLIQFLSNTQF